MGAEKKVLRAGIIGSGFAARFHFDAIQKVYGVKVEVVGAHSRNQDNLKKFSEEKGIGAFTKLEELIAASDVLHLCTPPVTHEPLAIQILKKDKDVIIEKPLTGYFGNDEENFSGDHFSREKGLKNALESVKKMLAAEAKSKGRIMYAENWVYAPAIQKEREVIEKTKSQVLWIQAQQSHSGSHSQDYGKWKLSGGGSLMGKGCHPLSGAIYLKHVEGKAKNGKPIRPESVTCRVHAITRMPNFQNELHLKDSYTDVEDYATLHVVFEDGTVADIVASELLHGGVKNYLEVHANNHRTICNLTPNNAMQTYNPVDSNFDDIYVVEKTGTKQGWSNISPDEGWFNGYQHEMEAFYRSAAFNEEVESNSTLAADVIATIYSAYLSAEKKGAEIAIPEL
ncbi:Gfo/Idh/MocA family protein [Autumnicola edwardsiae]|uniref:Gfo/Idh/MocA family oxidoreductase n=1 Tax=Autumnicola edwardsiae TaxID=3075594 RepID=A0ABU3CT28_9FLAO|nr:Gfo/Idh/MocA family oxidoreductase [Zunongwangia sp. F297]MDT0649524.1 Gfo/Idh/MocA family oxidoreductase [Zunongwangia sp. F297]